MINTWQAKVVTGADLHERSRHFEQCSDSGRRVRRFAEGPERGRSREQWKQKCETATARAEAAEALARKRLEELEQAHAQMEKLQAEVKKKWRPAV